MSQTKGCCIRAGRTWRISQVVPYGNGMTFEYCLNDRTLLSDSSAARYDDSDRRIAMTDSGGSVTGYTYDPAGNVETITSPDNYVINLRYDEANRVIQAYDEQNHLVRTDRDAKGRVRVVTDPNGNAVVYDYWDTTRDGRLRKITSPKIGANGTGPALNSGRSIEYDYDANGNVTTAKEIPASGSGLANRVTTTGYDELNRPVTIIGPQYTDVTNGNGCPITRNTYDALSRLTQVAAGFVPAPCTNTAISLPAQMSYAYDDFGRLISTTDALGRSWSYSYDANTNVQTAIDPRLQSTNYAWTTGRQLASRMEQGNRITTYTRNLLGQVTRVAHPEV